MSDLRRLFRRIAQNLKLMTLSVVFCIDHSAFRSCRLCFNALTILKLVSSVKNNKMFQVSKCASKWRTCQCRAVFTLPDINSTDVTSVDIFEESLKHYLLWSHLRIELMSRSRHTHAHTLTHARYLGLSAKWCLNRGGVAFI